MRPSSRALEKLESRLVIPHKLTFGFSKDPKWDSRLHTTPLSSELGKAWPAEVADAPEFQPNPRIVMGDDGGWLPSFRARIGKCISFGMSEERVRQAGKLLKALGASSVNAGWRGLIFKKYGFSFNEAKPHSLLVREPHPLLDRALTTKGHFDDVVYKSLLEMHRKNWIRNFAVSEFAKVHSKPDEAAAWNSLHHSHGPYEMEINEMHTSVHDQRGPTGNLTVCHRLRPGFVKPDGSMQNLFSVDSLVVSARQERVVAQATVSLSFVAKEGSHESDRFDELMAYYFLSKMMEQEKMRALAERTIVWIDHQLRQIEQDTWDKENAVEDLGTAAIPEQVEQKMKDMEVVGVGTT